MKVSKYLEIHQVISILGDELSLHHITNISLLQILIVNYNNGGNRKCKGPICMSRINMGIMTKITFRLDKTYIATYVIQFDINDYKAKSCKKILRNSQSIANS